MPSPSSSLATLRPDLSASFMQFDLAMDQEGFIAQRVLPVVDVAKAAGNFGIIPLAQLLQQPDTKRAPGSGYSRGKWKFDPSSYTTVEHGYEEPIDDNDAANYRDYFDVEQISAMRAYSAVLRGMEQRAADLLFNTGTFTGAKTGAATVAWGTPGSAVPVTDVEAGVNAVYGATGLWPNALIINRKTFRKLRNVAQIIDRLKYNGITDVKAEAITSDILSQVFDLEVIVAGSSKNTANESAAATPAQIWSDSYAMVARIESSQDFRRPCIGRTFHWSEDGSSIGGTVETYRDETIRGDVVRVRNQTDEHLLYAGAGYLITGVA